MTIKTRAVLKAESAVIRDETAANANTALRVGQHAYDSNDSASLRVLALGALDPTAMVFEQEGFYSQYTQSGAITFNVSGTVADGIGQVVYFISDGSNTISFDASKFHIGGGLYGIVNGGTLAAGFWKIWLFSENGKINVNVPATIPSDITAPAYSSSEIGNIADNKLVITMDETLDAASVPATTDFSHSGITGSPAITGVAITASQVTLTLASDGDSGDSPLISYVKGTNPLKDAVGNESANFTDEVVTNNVLGEDTATTAYFASLPSYTPSAGERLAYDTLIKALKAGNNVWSESDEIFAFYGLDQETFEAGLKVVSVGDLVGQTYADKNGVFGDGTISQAFKSDFIPDTDGVNYNVDDHCALYFVAAPSTGTNDYIEGLDQTATSQNAYIQNDITNTRVVTKSHGGTAIIKATYAMSANKWYGRALYWDTSIYRIDLLEDGAVLATGAEASRAFESGEMYIGGQNKNNGIFNGANAQIFFAIYGSSALKGYHTEIAAAFAAFKSAIDAV